MVGATLVGTCMEPQLTESSAYTDAIQAEVQAKTCTALTPNVHKVRNWLDEAGCIPADMSYSDKVIECGMLGKRVGKFLRPEVINGWFACTDAQRKFYPEDPALKPTAANLMYRPSNNIISYHEASEMATECDGRAREIEKGVVVQFQPKRTVLPANWGVKTKRGELFMLRPEVYTMQNDGPNKGKKIWLCQDPKGTTVFSHTHNQESIIYNATTGARKEQNLPEDLLK